MIKKSLRIKIEDILEKEEEIMSLIKNISKNYSNFSLNLWHNGIDKKLLNSFSKKYSKYINSINNNFGSEFFIIETVYDPYKYWRFKFKGGVIEGIQEYINILKRINKIQDENSYRWQ